MTIYNLWISKYKKHFFSSLKLFFVLIFLLQAAVYATSSPDSKNETIKVGWYPCNSFQEGASNSEPKSGYCYDYIQKIASYNGWKYSYVYGEWSDLLEKLRTGEIDIMAGVTDTPEREVYMSFPDYSMGTDIYTLFKHDDDPGMDIEDKSSFHGQKIGTVKDNRMSFFLEKWIKEKNINLEVVYYNGFTDRDKAFANRQIDGIVATDNNIMSNSGYSMITTVGEDPYYIAVTKSRSDLLKELNYALLMIKQMDPYFLENLQYSSYGMTLTNTTMTEQESNWLNEHNTINFGYMENYTPYSFKDKNGNVSGLITDVMKAIVTSLGIQDKLHISYKSYKNYDEMIKALQNNEIDAAFPVGGSSWNLDVDGINASNVVVTAGMNLVYKGKYQKEGDVVFAVNRNTTLQYYFTNNNFPQASINYYNSLEECIEAVYNGEADYTVVNGLRTEIVRNNKRYNTLSIMQLQKTSGRSIGVKHGNTPLLLLINRGLKLIGADYGINASYFYIDQYKKTTIKGFIREHLQELFFAVLIFLGFIILIFILYILGIKKAQKATKFQLDKNRELTLLLGKKNIELEALNKKLISAKDEAEAANHSKTDFLNNMSHDIRTPMNAILGFANLMENKMNEPDLLKQYLKKMEKSSEYLLEIINNVLEVARIDSGKMTVDESFVDLTSPDCNVYPLLENEINKNNLHFTCSMNIRHRYVFTDMPKIREINMNILSNAIKYTPEGGKIHLHFEEIPCDKEGYATYINTISDTGIGMSQEFQKKIFDSFSRERNSTESKVMGTGLGMTIVKRLVDLMGGTIEVESEIGKGTTFRVEMDHKIVEDPICYLKKQQDKIVKNNSFGGKRILLAEDNDLNAEIAIAILEEVDLLVDWAEDGIDCLDKLRKAESDYYDLILMDIQMPNLNGYETTEKIRRTGNKIPIIAMTANAFEEDKINAISSGMNDFISKPIMVERLMQILAEYLK